MFDLGAETSVVFFFTLLNKPVIINTFVIKSENNPFLNVRELFLYIIMSFVGTINNKFNTNKIGLCFFFFGFPVILLRLYQYSISNSPATLIEMIPMNVPVLETVSSNLGRRYPMH